MGAHTIDLNTFNIAREAYMNNDLFKSLLTLDSIQGFDSSLIRKELISDDGNSRFLENLIESRGENLVGVFDCPYHPYLMLEYSKIQDVLPTIEIETKFKNIRCVRQIESTLGLANDQVVAIFPENFRSITAAAEHPVFFFVDKFARRHLKYTRPLLQGFRFEAIFRPVNSLTDQKIGELVANWVNIHEASHRTGIMPIPQFLYEKSNRYTAALEELRADLITISKCLTKSSNERSDEYLTGIYVLAERLLAYSIFRDKTNFDAISSVIMWKFLNEHEVFSGEPSIEKFKEAVDNLIIFISKFESDSLTQGTPELRKLNLRGLILDYIGNYEKEFQKYTKFWSLK